MSGCTPTMNENARRSLPVRDRQAGGGGSRTRHEQRSRLRGVRGAEQMAQLKAALGGIPALG